MNNIKCDKCGFTDEATGDTAHVCNPKNKYGLEHFINDKDAQIKALSAENQRLRAIIEQDNVEPVACIDLEKLKKHGMAYAYQPEFLKENSNRTKLYLHPPKDSTVQLGKPHTKEQVQEWIKSQQDSTEPASKDKSDDDIMWTYPDGFNVTRKMYKEYKQWVAEGKPAAPTTPKGGE